MRLYAVYIRFCSCHSCQLLTVEARLKWEVVTTLTISDFYWDVIKVRVLIWELRRPFGGAWGHQMTEAGRVPQVNYSRDCCILTEPLPEIKFSCPITAGLCCNKCLLIKRSKKLSTVVFRVTSTSVNSDNTVQSGIQNASKLGAPCIIPLCKFWDMATLTCLFLEPWNINFRFHGF